MAGKTFTAKNLYFPLPQDEILNSQLDGKPTLTKILDINKVWILIRTKLKKNRPKWPVFLCIVSQ
jgi:hypothetical protein